MRQIVWSHVLIDSVKDRVCKEMYAFLRSNYRGISQNPLQELSVRCKYRILYKIINSTDGRLYPIILIVAIWWCMSELSFILIFEIWWIMSFIVISAIWWCMSELSFIVIFAIWWIMSFIVIFAIWWIIELCRLSLSLQSLITSSFPERFRDERVENREFVLTSNHTIIIRSIIIPTIIISNNAFYKKKNEKNRFRQESHRWFYEIFSTFEKNIKFLQIQSETRWSMRKSLSLGLFCQIIVYYGQTLRLGAISNFEIELYRDGIIVFLVV